MTIKLRYIVDETPLISKHETPRTIQALKISSPKNAMLSISYVAIRKKKDEKNNKNFTGELL